MKEHGLRIRDTAILVEPVGVMDVVCRKCGVKYFMYSMKEPD